MLSLIDQSVEGLNFVGQILWELHSGVLNTVDAWQKCKKKNDLNFRENPRKNITLKLPFRKKY